jgi:hypothetical protein
VVRAAALGDAVTHPAKASIHNLVLSSSGRWQNVQHSVRVGSKNGHCNILRGPRERGEIWSAVKPSREAE